VGQTCYDVSQVQQTDANDAMRRQQERRCSLFFGEREKLCRKLTQSIAIEGYDVHGNKPVKGREYYQRVFGGFSERLSLVDQQTCALDSSPGFWRCVTFDVDKRSYERYLKLDLVTTQLERGRQARDLVQSTGKLPDGFNKRRAFK
jgi:hypothetical protein